MIFGKVSIRGSKISSGWDGIVTLWIAASGVFVYEIWQVNLNIYSERRIEGHQHGKSVCE